ncbi:MAG: hypothetical protein A3J38_03965 [Gammaproteobacteria bacterium RIFCSPHIGHO2_12_FULL_45_9]|nr:MAG: hypothetical protein A3J38_03965 [Gammaproteobacteria bacterium RIFCSPHIGHO2_12_FULL_45_9]
MFILLYGMSLLGLCMASTRFLRIPTEVAPFFVVSSSIVFLYIFALLGFLPLGVQAIHIGGFLLGGWVLWAATPFALRPQPLTHYFTPSLTLSLCLTCIAVSVAAFAPLNQWDEFMHWAPHAKFMFLEHSLIQAADVTVHKTYPPGSSLFYLLFYGPDGFRDALCKQAQTILLLTPLFSLWKIPHWRAWPTLLAYALITGIVLGAFNIAIGFTSLYMEGVVGVYLGMMLVIYRQSTDRIRTILWLLPIMMAFTLLRPKMLPFVYLTTGLLMIDTWFTQSARRTQHMLLLCLLPLSAIFINASWAQYLHNIQVQREWPLVLAPATFIHSFTHPTLREYTVWHHFIYNMLWHSLGIVLLLYLSRVLTRPLTQRDARRFWAMQCSFILGFYAYATSLLILYFYTFPTEEALQLNSFTRYLSIYEIGWSIWILSYCFTIRIHTLLMILLAGFFLALQVFIYHHPHNTFRKHNWADWRTTVLMPITEAVRQHTPAHARIQLISQQPGRMYPYILSYDLLPRQVVIRCFRIQAHPPAAPHICVKTPDALRKTLAHVDYLLIASADATFWQDYGTLFPPDAEKYPLVQYTAYNQEIRKAYLFKIMHGIKGPYMQVLQQFPP